MNGCHQPYCPSFGRYALSPIERSTAHRYTTHACGRHLARLIRILDPRGVGVVITFNDEGKT